MADEKRPERDIIDLWIASNVYGEEGLSTELKDMNTLRLSTELVQLAGAIHQDRPPAALVERLGEIAGVDPEELSFDELLDRAREAAAGLSP